MCFDLRLSSDFNQDVNHEILYFPFVSTSHLSFWNIPPNKFEYVRRDVLYLTKAMLCSEFRVALVPYVSKFVEESANLLRESPSTSLNINTT